MNYVELKGSFKEIGRAHGEAFREEIRKYYDIYCLGTGKTPEELGPTVRRYVEDRLPEICEEIAGIAEGAGMGYEEILVYNHFNVPTGCTPIFFRDSELGPLLAQNLDCEPEELDASLVRNVAPESGHAYLGVGFVGTVWPGNWINDSGIARAGVSAHHHPYRTGDGTSGGIINCVIARNSGTIEDAFDTASSHRWLGKVGVLLYADENGRAIQMEGDADRKWKTEISGDFGFSTGLFITGNVVAQNEPDYLRPKHARKETIERLYRDGKIEFTLEGMKSLLAHHAPDPGSICRHDRAAGSCTQSSRIMIMRERKLLVTEGPPCTSEFKEFELKGGAL